MKLKTMKLTRFSLFLTLALGSIGQVVQASSINDLKQLSLEEFAELDVVVTSLSRKPQKLMDSAAAIHVISNEDIKRSGATSIPEALRLAPGIEVAQIDSSRWAVTSRGFNGLFARKLLVLMDGRTLYSPVFSGVLWDVQDTVLEDIDRIEVIRGPATAVWGGNAMNGVINIITKAAHETQGGLAVASVGNEVKGQTALRYGDKIGEDFYYRLYGKYKKNDNSTNVTDSNGSYDENNLNQIGFRADWAVSETDYLEFQGDAYKGDFEQEQRVALLSPTVGLHDVSRENEISGFNLISKWQHQQTETSSWTLQAFFDRARRQDTTNIDGKVDILDIDLKHQFMAFEQHNIIWGLGYRRILDDLQGKNHVSFSPERRLVHRYNAFFQDEIILSPDKFSLIIGSQLEHNDFTGFEIQPNMRFKWNIDKDTLAWAAVSRGLTIPDRGTEGGKANVSAIPGTPPRLGTFVGTETSKTEEVIAYELGYRTFIGHKNLLDVALFYNDYSHLRTNELGTPFLEATPAPLHILQPIVAAYEMDGESYGLEIAGEWFVSDSLTLKGHYRFFELDVNPARNTTAITPEMSEDLSPQHQASLQSLYQVSENLTFDTWLRYVDSLPENGANDYVDLDIRLAWQFSPAVELSLAGQNLLEGARFEYQDKLITSNMPSQVERGVYAKAVVRF